VLFAGGATTLLATHDGNYVPGDDIVLSSAELYDPKTGQFNVTGSMTPAREGPTATLLPDGHVLIAGGSVQALSAGRQTTASAELYDPKTGRFSPTGAMTTARVGHTATLLSDGRVLIAAGYGPSGPVASAELYDPATGRFSPTAPMATARADHAAAVLVDGRVLIAGGADVGGFSSPLASAELYDPNTGAFGSAGVMTTGRDKPTATLLPGGRVLIAGGADGYTGGYAGSTFNPAGSSFAISWGPSITNLALASAELYQP
jgi:hypothetical protein